MKFRVLIALLCPLAAVAAEKECVQSPGKVLELCVFAKGGEAYYEVNRTGAQVMAPAVLGLRFKGEPVARYAKIDTIRRTASDSSWEQPWGEQRVIRDNHAEMTVTLDGDTPYNKAVDVTFRLFDEGFGFRYDYKSVPAGKPVEVIAERTQFRPLGHYTAWWYQALGVERDEYLFSTTDARRITLAETPLTMKEDKGLHFSFHEAAMVDFPSMLLSNDGAGTYTSWLMPWPDGVLARKTGPFTTPWRTVLIGDTAGALADSRMELNLNEPNKMGADPVPYFKPGKFVGVWWEMHLGHTTWGSGPTHGATTAETERYIDFAAQNGIQGALAEGWNKGWDGEWIDNGDKFSFTESYPDFDLNAITAYARSKGVQFIGHNETAGAVVNYENQLEGAMALYEKAGVSVVKTGYVRHSGTIVDRQGGLEWFAGQYMVRHHALVREVAAKHHIAIDAHEPVKDTGLRRTYPNLIAREGARGQEYNAWGKPTSPPEHVTILPFTRFLGGPMDYTPGIFDVKHGEEDVNRRVQSTLATQLGLYVVLYSPVQMAADMIENYEKHMDAFQFIKDVPTDWETSKTLGGEVGQFVVSARLERGGKDWYLGAVTNDKARKVGQKLDFLTPGKHYEAQIYEDGPGADYITNPMSYKIEKKTVTSADSLTLDMAPGGGLAIRFRALD